MSEATFWNCTPRKLFALLDVHIDQNTTDEQKAEQGIRPRNINKVNSRQTVNSIASW